MTTHGLFKGSCWQPTLSIELVRRPRLRCPRNVPSLCLHSPEVWGDSLPSSSFPRLFAPSLELSTAKKKKTSASPGARPQLQKQRDYGSELIPLLICIRSSPTPSICSQPPSLASRRLFHGLNGKWSKCSSFRHFHSLPVGGCQT